MADPRTFVLIGNFTDNITPSLEKINKSLEKVKANLESMTKATKPLKNEFKDLADISKNFATSLKGQATDIREVTAAMRAMRNEMGRVNRAYRAGGNRIMRQAAPPPPPPPPIIPTPRSAVQPRTGGRRAAGGSGFAAAVGGGVAGSQLGDMITGSIVRGFQLGVSLMMRPFQYGANAFGERIRDELTDIQSAGGLFAVDQRKNLGMFRDFQEARVAQEAINYRLAKSAAALPGATAQYVQEAKRVTDTMIGAMARQPQQFMKLGEEFGAKTGDKMDALGAVIQKFTEKTVLLGKGGGGYRGIYSMPMLLEMMVNRPEVNAQSMAARYSVLRDNPMLMAAIQDAEDEINKTGAGTADRLRALMKVLDQALPNEVIQGMKNSMDGIIEVIKSSFLDPEVGLFGLGRKMQDIGPAVDQFGRYVNEQGKVVNSLAEAAKADLSLFAIIRDILGGFALPLSELAQILPELFDPLRNIGEGLIRFRTIAQKFYANFNQYTAEFETLAKEIGGKAGAEIKRTAGARGALLSVANLLRGIGAIDMSKYSDVAKKLQAEKPDLGAITGDLFKTLFNSDVMRTLGEAVGTLVGSTIKMVGDLMKGATDLAEAGPFAAGLKKGWDASKGAEGIANIFKSLFKVISNALTMLFKSAPFEMTMLTAFTLGMPIITGLISAGVTSLFEALFSAKVLNFAKTKLMNLLAASMVRASVMTTTPAAAGAALGATTTTAGAAGFGALLTRMLPILGRLSVWLTAIVMLGGGLENTLRQLGQAFGEIWNSLSGAFGGLFDTLGVLTGFVGDLGRRIGELIGGMFGLGQGFDAIKVALAPVTLALQLLNMGLRGLALGLAEVRVFLARITGDKEYQNRIKERDELASKLAQDRGRINAYNASMLGKENVRKQMNDAIFELQNSKQLKAPRSAELRSFIAEARSQLGQKNGIAPGEKGSEKPSTAEKITATSVQGINDKSSKQLTATDAARKATEGTKKATEATKSAVTSQKASLDSIQSTLSSMFTLLASGTLRVVTSIQGQTLIPGFTPPPANNTPFGQIPPQPGKQNKYVWPLAGGSLGDAVASEMRMKPPGSDLVIANTSETIIPAAGGYGMLDFVETLRAGFAAVVATYKESQQKQDNTLKSIRDTLVSNQQQTNARLQKLETKFTTPGLGGLGSGSMGGGVDSFTPLAQRYGLQMTSGYRPGDPGWHGANRARDYSNSTGPTPQMMQFAQFLASNYGANLKELIYTPLGFSIKNGQKVPPIAAGTHYNHVHVAYALGQGMPAFFGSQSDALSWERSMMRGSVKVGSVTGNSAEGFGGGTTINGGINVTVNGSGVSDADELASIVALKIGEAVADARAASIFV